MPCQAAFRWKISRGHDAAARCNYRTATSTPGELICEDDAGKPLMGIGIVKPDIILSLLKSLKVVTERCLDALMCGQGRGGNVGAVHNVLAQLGFTLVRADKQQPGRELAWSKSGPPRNHVLAVAGETMLYESMVSKLGPNLSRRGRPIE